MRGRAVVAGAVVLACLLVAALTVAAEAPRPGATAPGVVRWWPVLLVLVAAAGVLVVVVASLRDLPTSRPVRSAGPKRSWLTSLVAAVVLGGLAALLPRSESVGGLLGDPPALGGAPTLPDAVGVPVESVATPSVLAVVVLVLLAVGALATAVLRRRATVEVEQPPALDEAVAAARARLVDASDARTAVLAAFATLEDRLGATGLARDEAETQAAWVERLLLDHGVPAAPARRLRAGFERARFATGSVTEDDRRAALADLAALLADRHPA